MLDLGRRGLILKCKASTIKPGLLLATANVVEVTAEPMESDWRATIKLGTNSNPVQPSRAEQKAR